MLTLSKRDLELERAGHHAVVGTNERKQLGLVPAFMDARTRKVYASTFADGAPAPFHLLDGLPDELVVARDRRLRPSQVRGSVIAGFSRNGRFYTRDEAAALVRVGASHGHAAAI